MKKVIAAIASTGLLVAPMVSLAQGFDSQVPSPGSSRPYTPPPPAYPPQGQGSFGYPGQGQAGYPSQGQGSFSNPGQGGYQGQGQGSFSNPGQGGYQGQGGQFAPAPGQAGPGYQPGSPPPASGSQPVWQSNDPKYTQPWRNPQGNNGAVPVPPKPGNQASAKPVGPGKQSGGCWKYGAAGAAGGYALGHTITGAIAGCAAGAAVKRNSQKRFNETGHY